MSKPSKRVINIIFCTLIFSAGAFIWINRSSGPAPAQDIRKEAAAETGKSDATPPSQASQGEEEEATTPKSDIISIEYSVLPESKPTAPPEVASENIRNLMQKTLLFESGTEQTHTFRIPALITAPNGDLIACCDARRATRSDLRDSRDIDIVIKRSSDNGKSWSEIETICDFGEGRPASDAAFILDKINGEIFCLYNYMDQDNAPKEFRFYVQSSKNSGKTWSKARDITEEISKPEWKMDFKFITSGRGIQLRGGVLLHTLVNIKKGLHLFGSKDHGKSWQLIDVPVKPANESKVVELVDGSWMINSRVSRAEDSRWIHLSKDQGQSWSSSADKNLIDPGCNASIIRYTSKKDGYAKNRLLFCNPSSPNRRKNLAVRISYDEGKTWSKGKVIDPDPVAYSSLTICKDGSIGVLYEAGKNIRFARFTLEDLTNDEDRLSKPYWP
jgi:sialidase-1